MNNKVEIVLNAIVDQSIIIGSTPFNVRVAESYINSQNQVIDLNSLNVKYKDAFKDVLDYCAFIFNENARVIEIKKNNKTFDLSSSYIRNSINTAGLKNSLPNGFPFIIKFEIPGFTTFKTIEISAWYNQNFLQQDIDLLAENSIVLTGNGKMFAINNAIECRLNFVKPDNATEFYLFNNEFASQIITV